MRKRTILAVLATVLIVCLSNNLWLSFSPLSVDFDINAKSTGNIEVRLTHGVNKIYDGLKFSEINHLNYSVDNAKFHKKIKFYFSGLNNVSPIVLNNITLRNGKVKLDKWKNFKIEGGKLEVKNNSLIIKPDYNFVVLTYNEPFKFIRTNFKFDFQMFLIISIVSFLFMYKFSNYIADFKTVKKQSRIEIIFLTIFFVMLFIPMSKINQDEISKNENRRLAQWQPLITQDGKLNYNFGNDFNDWFNDRFNFRKNLIDINTVFSIYTQGKANGGYIDFKTGFVYLRGEISHITLTKIPQESYESLLKFDKFCKDNNIELYVLLVPDKGYVYPNKQIRDNNKLLIQKEVIKLNRQGMHIIDPLVALQKHTKDNFMYFKMEHHWTDDGAFIGYKELMKEIVKKHPDINVLNYNDFDYSFDRLVRGDWDRRFLYGQNSWRLSLPQKLVEKLHDVNYRYFTHKDANLLGQKIIDEHFKKEKIYTYSKGANYKVIQLGTSQNENLTEFIPYTFKNVKRLRTNNVKDLPQEEEFKIKKYYEREILDYKPDIIIFCITYDNLPQLSSKIFNME